ncbi:LysR family transcriptional regulator [Curvibacter sp. APW13]|uniref:LysR family transcriptional regulator n=1 Tax=Curvibacter sp. APW13 TaxID=3077236 RepID=UPI0028E0491E|nr:LysR family transcriptional regulator [Curvibacter sp. APW13]MDT8990988.1 LysR family transcriptional regulator [Curvibacter sp. APW13]
MNITFRQLRLFLALADTGSVSQAARAMHVTQPTASMQLREVTQALGMPLYEVIGRKVYLTQAGLELARTARTMVDEWERLEQTVGLLHGLQKGRLQVSVVSTAKYFIPRLIGQFCREHPHIDVAIEVLNRDGVVQRLRDNRDDLYVMSQPPADMDLQDQVFMSNPLVLIGPHARRGASLQLPRTLSDLKSERLILREAGSGTRMAVNASFAARRFRPGLLMELGSNEAIKEAVAAGLGYGIVSRHALGKTPSSQGVRVLELPGFPIASAWHVVYPRRKSLSPLAQKFLQRLTQLGDAKA